jgi:hypothetical protein
VLKYTTHHTRVPGTSTSTPLNETHYAREYLRQTSSPLSLDCVIVMTWRHRLSVYHTTLHAPRASTHLLVSHQMLACACRRPPSRVGPRLWTPPPHRRPCCAGTHAAAGTRPLWRSRAWTSGSRPLNSLKTSSGAVPPPSASTVFANLAPSGQGRQNHNVPLGFEFRILSFLEVRVKSLGFRV